MGCYRHPYFDFGEIAEESLDEISKFVQRTAAVGLMPKTPAMINFLTDRLGVPAQIDTTATTEEIAPMLTGYTSGASEGLAQGSGSGTAKNVSADDNLPQSGELMAVVYWIHLDEHTDLFTQGYIGVTTKNC